MRPPWADADEIQQLKVRLSSVEVILSRLLDHLRSRHTCPRPATCWLCDSLDGVVGGVGIQQQGGGE